VEIYSSMYRSQKMRLMRISIAPCAKNVPLVATSHVATSFYRPRTFQLFRGLVDEWDTLEVSSDESGEEIKGKILDLKGVS
jgi:hypothetical protein